MTSPLMKPTLVGRDTLHELDQPLKKLAYVSNRWGPLLSPPIMTPVKSSTTEKSTGIRICILIDKPLRSWRMYCPSMNK